MLTLVENQDHFQIVKCNPQNHSLKLEILPAILFKKNIQ